MISYHDLHGHASFHELGLSFAALLTQLSPAMHAMLRCQQAVLTHLSIVRMHVFLKSPLCYHGS